MQPRPLRTTVIGSYPFPAWLESACARLGEFGKDDIAEMENNIWQTGISNGSTSFSHSIWDTWPAGNWTDVQLMKST